MNTKTPPDREEVRFLDGSCVLRSSIRAGAWVARLRNGSTVAAADDPHRVGYFPTREAAVAALIERGQGPTAAQPGRLTNFTRGPFAAAWNEDRSWVGVDCGDARDPHRTEFCKVCAENVDLDNDEAWERAKNDALRIAAALNAYEKDHPTMADCYRPPTPAELYREEVQMLVDGVMADVTPDRVPSRACVRLQLVMAVANSAYVREPLLHVVVANSRLTQGVTATGVSAAGSAAEPPTLQSLAALGLFEECLVALETRPGYRALPKETACPPKSP